MKINADKYDLLVSTNSTVKMNIGTFDITNELNLSINSNLMITFQNYVKMLVEKFKHCQV